MSTSSEFNKDLSTCIEADLPKSRCLQLWLALETYTTTNQGFHIFSPQTTQRWGLSFRIPEKELMFIQNCTRDIMDPALIIKICLLSSNIPHLQPFSSITT